MFRPLLTKLTAQFHRSGGLRGIWKTYGYAGVGTYFGIYFSSLGLLTVAARRGNLRTATVDSAIKKYLPVKLADKSSEDTLASQFLVAWVACKLIEPLRLGATLALMPYVRRRFF